MDEFARFIGKLEVSRQRGKQSDLPVTPNELNTYQSLAGKMNWLGHAMAPHYAFAAGYMQQELEDLRVKHLV